MTTDQANAANRVDEVLASIDDALNDAEKPQAAASEGPQEAPQAPSEALPVPERPERPEPAESAEKRLESAPSVPLRRPATDDWWVPLYQDDRAHWDTHSGGIYDDAGPAAAGAPQPPPPPAGRGDDVAKTDGEDAPDEPEDQAEPDESDEGDGAGRRRWSFRRAPNPHVTTPGPIETAFHAAQLHQSGWYPRRVWWVLRWGTPALVAWKSGLVDELGKQLSSFDGDIWGWGVLTLLPCLFLTAKTQHFYPPLAWVLRIPISALALTSLSNAPVHVGSTNEGIHMDGHQVVIAADLGGGLNLGTVSAAGLAAIITAFLVFYLKTGGENKYVRWVNTEILIIMGFAASGFYEAAGWKGPSDFILSLTEKQAASWGYGALAIIITGFLLLRKHSNKRAVICGFIAATLYAAAGGDWAWPQNLITLGCESVGLV
ncbi:hypothetical protein PV726_31930 [Streptomyces europaeiscabiei]|uniref:hypothetical protein n=1 Tax=Streptomyces europaeiscabiei TaxID=146819 RepID=UPI0029A9CFE0|nr:hypothetical protein [Streptomyces europaeiscabiei]MDX3694865.1 hypothetical protein [Streptomyces europaeiscabiei]